MSASELKPGVEDVQDAELDDPHAELTEAVAVIRELLEWGIEYHHDPASDEQRERLLHRAGLVVEGATATAAAEQGKDGG